MSASPEPSVASAPHDGDPLRQAAPLVDDVEARRARAAIASRLFTGPPQPVRVGRYVVEGRLGAGGMGVVYRAHDPELARDVAVKLLNAEGTRTNDPATARARLVREARAMARLSHPNVINVYDVGTVEDGVFIAMELVEGRSLSRWLAEEHPPWREILRKYVEAGRGLAAAHAAGVIHRDFKPENVLLGDDDRVRVVDFGLAGGPTAFESASEESQLDRNTDDLHGPAGSLTQTGTLLGTPKYMAPEQESGAVANARSDQFSLCVALYEALNGRPPFAGSTVAEYRHNVRHGRVLDPAPESKVRAWVHAEIVRGLAVDPADRHAELEPLLDRLEEALVDPNIARRRRRRARVIAMTTGAAALFVFGGLGLWIVGDDEQPAIPATATSASETMAPAPKLMAQADPPPRAPPVAFATVPAEVADTNPAPETETPELDDETQAQTADQPKSPPRSNDGSDAPPKPRRKRQADTCYFQQDRFKFLQRSRRHRRFVTGNDARCYDCEIEAPAYRRAQLSPSDCARYYLCVSTDEEQCTG